MSPGTAHLGNSSHLNVADEVFGNLTQERYLTTLKTAKFVFEIEEGRRGCAFSVNRPGAQRISDVLTAG